MRPFLTLAFLPLLTLSTVAGLSAKSTSDLLPSQLFNRARSSELQTAQV
jgi:hypothetical protein